MNGHPQTIAIGTTASFEETSPGYFTVTLGANTRAITKDGTNFIAWIGYRSSHWCFARALKACVEDMEYQAFQHAEAKRTHDEAIASLMQMTPAEKARLIAKLETELDLLDYSDAHVDVAARKAQFDRQIATLCGVA